MAASVKMYSVLLGLCNSSEFLHNGTLQLNCIDLIYVFSLGLQSSVTVELSGWERCGTLSVFVCFFL